MADVEFSGNQVIVRIPKAILILTKAQFMEALRRGKAYRRAQRHQQRTGDRTYERYSPESR